MSRNVELVRVTVRRLSDRWIHSNGSSSMEIVYKLL